MVVQRNVDFLADIVSEFSDQFDSGTATVPAGSSTRSVTFTVSVTNPVVVASPTADPQTRWWISGITGSGFTFNLAAVATGIGVPFSWIVRGK